MRTSGALLRNRDFTVLWAGQTISELGSRMSMFVFPLLAYALTGSALWAAAAETAHLIGLCGTLLPAGVLADRLDRRRLMRTASATGALLYTSLVLAALTTGITVPHLLLVATVTGAGAGLFMPAESSAVRSVVGDEQLATALAQNQARQHLAGLVGGPFGGALFSIARWLPFATDAVTYAISWVLLGRIRTDLSATRCEDPRAAVWQSLVDGFAFILRRPLLRVVMIFSALVNVTINALVFAAILRLVQAGFAPAQIGLVETVSGLFGVAGAIVAPWLIRRFRTGSLAIAVGWSWVPLAVPVILWNHPAAVAISVGTGLFLTPTGNASMGAYRMAVTPPELQGRVQSATQFVAMSMMPLSPMLAGGLLAWLGGGTTITVLGALTALVALIPTLSRSVRAVPRPAVWQAELRERVATVAPLPTDPLPATASSV